MADEFAAFGNRRGEVALAFAYACALRDSVMRASASDARIDHDGVMRYAFLVRANEARAHSTLKKYGDCGSLYLAYAPPKHDHEPNEKCALSRRGWETNGDASAGFVGCAGARVG